jgi:hypothetical protein
MQAGISIASQYPYLQDTLMQPTMIRKGVAYQVFQQKGGAGFWTGCEPYAYPQNTQPRSLGTPCVYIGTGDGIIENVWDKLF